MDFVQAKSILDKFAQAYRAAEFMSQALEAAASLERRGMELTNNVEHLRKEQDAQQTSLTAMQAGFVQAKAQMEAQHAERLAALRAQADAERTRVSAEQAQAAEAVRTAKGSLEAATVRAQGILGTLDVQIADKTKTLAALERQIEALKAQAQKVLT
jgi:predicted  nucleic acid-binding Zn-ribbon protein